MKYYVVLRGRTPGIYFRWEDCKAQVHGFKNPLYRKFDKLEEAVAFIERHAGETGSSEGGDARGRREERKEEAASLIQPASLPPDLMVAYVDGSYNSRTKEYGYGIVELTREGRADHFGSFQGDYSSSRNVAGEVEAARRAIQLAVDKGYPRLTIYYDYAGIEKWALGEWKTNIPLTQEYKDFCRSMQDRVHLDFIKVAAHTGDPYNEAADALAKKGAGIRPGKKQNR